MDIKYDMTFFNKQIIIIVENCFGIRQKITLGPAHLTTPLHTTP